MVTKLFIFTIFTCEFVNSANILGIFNDGSKIHYILGEALLKALAQRGHNVTMASAYPLKEKLPNYTDLNLTGILEDQLKRPSFFFEMNGIEEMLDWTRTQTEITLNHTEIKKLIQSGAKFDLIIMNWFMNYALLIYSEIFDVPVIALASAGSSFFANDITGNPSPPSYVPIAGSLFPPTNMSFIERIGNTATQLAFNLILSTNIKYHDNLLTKYFDEPPKFEQLRKRVALVLSNAHFSIEPIRPYLPSVINIGGFHIQEPPEVIPDDLKDAMDNAEHGIIYFSLGSNVRSNFLKIETQRQILKVFENLDELVLWKWDGEDLENIPENVILSKWFPQHSILAHEKLKLFITHGGLLSTIEAIHFGIPIIGIPVFGDQKMNVDIAIKAGYAEKINLNNLNEYTLRQKIKKVLSNEKYKSNVMQRSILLREQPIHPLNHAIFWIEHVIKHKGAPHLQNAAIDLNFYEYFLLDVLIVAGVLFTLLFVFIYFLFKYFYSWIVYIIMYKEKVE